MANTILIKKAAYNSTTAPSGTGLSSALAYGELGWLNNNTGSTGKLYIGGKTASTASPAGETYPVDIQANIISAIPIATAGANAGSSVEGKASFSNADFGVTGDGFATIKAGGVLLGTQTTGNYVATAVAGAGIDVSGATGNVTVSIGTAEVTHAMLGDNVIDGDNIQDDVINSEHYAALSIDAEHIAAGQITTAKLVSIDGSESVTTATIRALNVTDAELATDSVINSKIADSAVSSAKIANGTIVAGDIASGTITGTQIASGITLAGDVTIAGDITVGGAQTIVNSTNIAIADKQITVASNVTANAQLATTTGVADSGFRVGTHASAPKITWQNLGTTQYFEVANGNFKATLEDATIDCGAY